LVEWKNSSYDTVATRNLTKCMHHGQPVCGTLCSAQQNKVWEKSTKGVFWASFRHPENNPKVSVQVLADFAVVACPAL